MGAASRKPGTSRWAYLQTTIYAVFLLVGLPVTISSNTGPAWITFSLLMAAGFCNITAAWVLRRHTRRRTSASAPATTPQR